MVHTAFGGGGKQALWVKACELTHSMFTQHDNSNRLIQTEIHISIHMLISLTVSCKDLVITVTVIYCMLDFGDLKYNGTLAKVNRKTQNLFFGESLSRWLYE